MKDRMALIYCMYLWKNDVNDDCLTLGEGTPKKISEFKEGIKSINYLLNDGWMF